MQKVSLKIKQIYGNIRIELITLQLCYMHPSTPRKAKFFLAITLAYAASPIDLIPDFIPVLGHLDDAIIIPLLAILSYRFIPKNIISECRQRASKTEFSLNKSWISILLVLLLHLIIVGLTIKLFFSFLK